MTFTASHKGSIEINPLVKVLWNLCTIQNTYPQIYIKLQRFEENDGKKLPLKYYLLWCCSLWEMSKHCSLVFTFFFSPPSKTWEVDKKNMFFRLPGRLKKKRESLRVRKLLSAKPAYTCMYIYLWFWKPSLQSQGFLWPFFWFKAIGHFPNKTKS